MEDFEGGKVHAQYSSFSVASEADGYQLDVTGYIDGGAGRDGHTVKESISIFYHECFS